MKKLLYITGILTALWSCTERVDIDLDSTWQRLVVDGYITTDTTSHFIKLSKTTDYYYNQEPPAVTGAIVEISDNQGNTVRFDEQEDGLYYSPPDYYAETGKTYTLNIRLEEEINGYKDYSASSTVLDIYPVDSISLLYHSDWGTEGFYEVQCWYQDPVSADFYMFNIFKNQVLMTDTIDKRMVTDDLLYNGSYTNGIGVGWLDQSIEREKVNPGDTIVFQAAKITEEYANYIWTLQTEISFNTPLFSGPPANVKSNVSNGAVGFFAVYSVTYSSAIAK